MKCSRIVSSILALALVFNLFAAVAFAKTSRTALITDVSGDVSVTKGGGVNPIPAFPNMPLNEGDSITTGEDGTVTVQIADPDSTRTIGPNSDVAISELSDDAGGKKSGFKVWVGSMWNKVKTLASGNEDEVETPTATMGVRGTQYLVIANPDGTLSVVVASGLVDATLSSTVTSSSGSDTGGGSDSKSSSDGTEVLLAPTQQIELNPAAPPTELANAVSIVDVTNVVQQSDPSIIKAFVVDAPNIAAENKQLIDQLKADLQDGKSTTLQRGGAVSDLSIKNLDDLNKVSQNINGLVANIANKAIQLNKVQSTELTNLINQANGKIGTTDQKIDLNNVKPIDKTAGVNPADAQKKQDEQNKLNQQLQQQALVRQQQQAQLAQQLAAALQQIADQQKKLDEENKKAQDDMNKKAESSYVNTLSDADKQAYEGNKSQLPNTSPTSPPTSTSHNSNSSSVPNAPSSVTMNDMSTAITGVGPAGVTITVEGFDGTAYNKVATGTIGTSGTFTLNASALLPAGTKLRAYTTNSDGSSSYLLGEVQEGTPTVSAMTSPNTITGTAGAGSTVQVYSGTTLLSSTLTLLPSGVFTVTLANEVYDQTLRVVITNAKGTATTLSVTTLSTTPLPSVSLSTVQSATGTSLQVKLKGFTGANAIYAAELHFLSNDYVDHNSTDAALGTPIRSSSFTSTNSADMVKSVFGTVDGQAKEETIYAVTNFNTNNTVSFDNDDVLVTIPITITNAASGDYKFTLPYVLFVDSKGNPISVSDTSGLSAVITK